MLYAFLILAYNILFLQKRRNKRLFNQLLPKHFVIDKALKKRIQFYTMQSTITNLWFGTLRGYSAASHETDTGLLLGAVTPVYDDLLDEHQLTHSQLHENQQFSNDQLANLVNLYRWLDHAVKGQIGLKTEYLRYLDRVISAQAQSQLQLSTQVVGKEGIVRITKEKGGSATLLYRCLLSNPLKVGEEEAIFELGALLQLMNDLFDLYKDTQAGAATLVTRCQQPSELLTLYDQQLEKVFQKFASLPYPAAQRRRTIRLILTMVSQGYVCIYQFLALQEQFGHFEAVKYSRKQLICDMDKFGNQLSSLAIANQLYKRKVKPLLINKPVIVE